MNKFILIGALPESLINFRGSLIQTLLEKGCKVTAMASQNEATVTKKLEMLGADFRPYLITRNGLNPLTDLKTWLVLRQTFLALQPDIILAYTIKPVIWSGLASRIMPNTRFYALITGLGFAFQGHTLKRKILSQLVTFLYRLALKHSKQVIFQNPDNRDVFIKRGIVPADKCVIVNGSGVDTAQFQHIPLPTGKTTFLAIGRLLGEKGFREYAQAAQIVKVCYPNTTFQLLGPEDPSHDRIPLTEVQAWHDQGILDYLGSTNNVKPYLQQCHIYVLPSYHEGMPRTVLEAMAMGRPILTTDVPGCRETVVNGDNGYLVPKADAQALAKRMIWFIEHHHQWQRMGQRSRALAEEKYDIHKVNAQLMEIMGI